MGAIDPSSDAGDDIFQDLPSDDPDIEHKVDLILARSLVVQSHDGTSQYSHKGVSACGLASFNAIKCVLDLEKAGYRGGDLVRMMLTRDLVEDAVGICSLWPSSAHLEADEIYQFPYFSRSLKQVGMHFGQPSYEQFMTVLRRLNVNSNGTFTTAAVITKPPEIVAVLAINTKPRSPPTFVVFDSHSRPTHHPQGAAFSFFPTAELAAEYLDTLLSIDPAILSDSRMQWQAQLLSSFSAHYLVAAEPAAPLSDIDLFKVNIAGLELKAALSDAKAELAGMTSKHVQTMAENNALRDEINLLKIQLSTITASLRHAENERDEMYADLEVQQRSPPSRRKGKEKEVFPEQDTASSSRQGGSGDFVSWTDRGISLPGVISSITSVFTGTSDEPERKPSGSSSRRSKEKALEADHLLAARLHIEAHEQTDAAARQASQNQLLRDAHVAAEMQRQMDAEDNVLRDEHFALAQSAQGRFDCGVCFETCPEDALARLDGCDHDFCRDCLKGHVVSSLEMMRFPIMCPVCVTEVNKTDDHGIVTQDIVEILGVSEEEFTKWVNFELAKFCILLDCPKCRQSVLVDKDDHANAEIIACPMAACDYRWCKKCHQAASTAAGHSCDGTKELEALMKTQGWKHCPGCQTPTERTEGCNHMTCKAPGCNTHFCYVDGASICRTQNSAVAKSEVDAHYRTCALFDVPAGI